MPTGRLVGFWFYLSLVAATAGPLLASVYANLSHDITDPEDWALFPPFRAGANANHFDHLGGEYFEIAKAIRAGRGFADPFVTPTGPTAWMPPLLPYFQAGLLAIFRDDKTSVANTVTVLQALTLALTGALTICVARRTAPRVPSPVVAGLVALALVTRFHTAFQFTHDSWLVLLAMDFVTFGAVFGRGLIHPARAIGWGIGGGLCALASPIVGLCWAVATLAEMRSRRGAAIALAVSALTVSPWMVRNAVVFGRFIPVKSNLAYELYQSQIVSPDGRLSDKVFQSHPYATFGPERAECIRDGEMAFLDARRTRFWADVRANPGKFRTRVWERLAAATVDYSPMDVRETERETLYTLCYQWHAIPVIAAAGLLAIWPFQRLPRGALLGMGLVAVYLAPYVVVSYYERYEFPLWGLKTLIVVWWLAAILPNWEESA